MLNLIRIISKWREAAWLSCSGLLHVLVIVVLVVSPSVSAKSSEQVDAASYPSLSKEELGHVHRFVALSRQLPGDWSGMSDDLWSIAERTRQFQLSYMAMGLALTQHSYTPAYRELYREAMYDLVQKMTIPDIWESFIHSSRAGVAFADPDSPDIQHGWIDPIRRYNIMLKAYLLQAGAMYESLYRDGRFTASDAYTFNYQPVTWGNGPLTFRYSISDIAEIIYKEHVEGNYQGVQCEPNRIFPACNQPPILALKTHDHLFGTRYAEDVAPKFAKNWVDKNYTDPASGQNVNLILVKQQDHELPGDAVLDGWGGAWMHAWNPELIQSIYPRQREVYLEDFLNGNYAIDAPPHGPRFGNRTYMSLGFGQFAFMAAEVGDTTARKALLEYADRNFNPIWEDGAFYYPRNDDYATDAEGNSHGMDTWTGNVLLPLVRLNKGGGFLKLYNEPWTEKELHQPEITNVDDLTTHVTQAWYDDDKRALIVTLKPGVVAAGKISFNVEKLNREKDYVISKDGKVMSKLDAAQTSGKARWSQNDSLVIETDLKKPHTFIISEVRG